MSNGYTRRAIIAAIKANIKKWVATIDEDRNDVKDAIQNNYIVTGGAIASMLLGEAPNDYDVYFRNRESAKIVARYYISKMTNLKTTDMVSRIEVRDTDHGINIMIKSLGVATPDTELKEYRYFEAESNETLENFLQQGFKDKEVKKPNEVAYISSNAITLTGGIQMILRFCGSPEEIHENFDFIHASSYYEGSTDKLTLRPEAMEALLQKRLVYFGSRFPLASLFRIRKFMSRGFTISAGEITKIAFDVSRLDLSDPMVLKDQLMGMDQAYFNEVLDIIREKIKTGVEVKELDRTYLFEILNQVFDGYTE